MPMVELSPKVDDGNWKIVSVIGARVGNVVVMESFG